LSSQWPDQDEWRRGVKTMKAIVQDEYGTAPEDVLRVAEIARPTIGGAADQSMPIVITPGETLPAGVDDWIAEARPTRTVLFGGPVALSQAVEAAVPHPLRVSGAERTATAVAVPTTLWQPFPERRYVLIHGGREDGWAFGLAAAGLAADAGRCILDGPAVTFLAVDARDGQPPAGRALAPTARVAGIQDAVDPLLALQRREHDTAIGVLLGP
jgi:hypothetical protein